MSDVRDTLVGMRKAQEYLDGRRTLGEDSIIRDLLSAVEKVLALCDAELALDEFSNWGEHGKATMALTVRKAIQEALGGVNHD